MATIVLGAVGAAVGASIGGGILGLSSVVIGQAIGSSIGRALDQRLMGSGSSVVETPRVDRFRLTSAGEGNPIPQVYGRMRVGGQVIWATRFKESVNVTPGEGGKGSGSAPTPELREYTYSVSMAIALCEGVISHVGRVWADGEEIARDSLHMRVHRGGRSQPVDSKIAAVEPGGHVPAFRGTAYVVIEDLELGRFGNRVPQFTFEVMRPVQDWSAQATNPTFGIQGAALIPGSGEYALATRPVYFQNKRGNYKAVNVNSPSGKTDFETSMESLRYELRRCDSVSLVVSWFGDDLRCGHTGLRPKVEQNAVDGKGMSWSVSGQTRNTAAVVPQVDGKTIYGGTPTDKSVKNAISELKSINKSVVFYPFILMDQVEGNTLPNPWTGTNGQPALPWRGRITTDAAPGVTGSTDGTAAAAAEVDAFFGSAKVSDFSETADGVTYSGPNEWSYRRFILHNAKLCAAAGGVDAFCIGSEMRGLTQIRGANNSFPAVAKLIELARDVRQILGAGTKIGYAADWSEYFGYQPQDGSGDVFFHLDTLWADDAIDFVGIDNYMPLSDWRDGQDHADVAWGSIYNPDYLKSNIAGGEGYDWYYATPQDEAAQVRTPITDGAYGEPWVYRYKDIRNWWSNPHHNRIGGVREGNPTPWVPESKPIWFTEYGCAAIDKATNQPNKFLDKKSSESSLPKYSNGRRDETIQMQYLAAMLSYWKDPANNPQSSVYGAEMVDMARAHVWAWDTRPFPFFPYISNRWSDANNYARGHWWNGRSNSRALADVVTEICQRSGLVNIDTSKLFGYVRGYTVSDVASARAALQPLMLAYGFEAIEREGVLTFKNRDGVADVTVAADDVTWEVDGETPIEKSRAPDAETVGRLRLNFLEADGEYEARTEEAVFPDDSSLAVSQSEIPLLLTRAEARAITEKWLAEARVARDNLQFSLPLSRIDAGAGDVVRWRDAEGETLYRIDRVTQTTAQTIEAVRVEPEVYEPSDSVEQNKRLRPFSPAVPVLPMFMDLPLLTGEEKPDAPHLAVTADPWPGAVACYSSSSDSNYSLNRMHRRPTITGVTQTLLKSATPGLLDRGEPLRVELSYGDLSTVSLADMLNGANAAAIGDGSPENWEIFQFTDAVLVDPGIYDISGRLRGQAGTDALDSREWPAGSIFVLLDGSMKQISLKSADRGLARHYRIGPANVGYDDPSYEYFYEAFSGVGLRPFAPVHVRARPDGNGGFDLTWVRRTRIDGDGWQSGDVPLGEENETYVVQVLSGGVVVREATVSGPAWAYSAGQMASDGVASNFTVQVAQMSVRYGPGLFGRISING